MEHDDSISTKKIENILISHKSKEHSLDEVKIKNFILKIAQLYHIENLEVSLTFVSQEQMQEINFDYRNIDKPTDVLSFPQFNWNNPVTIEQLKTSKLIEFLPQEEHFLLPRGSLGDLVISITEAEQNAKKIGQSLTREVGFLIIHGLLHLLGHDHMEPEEKEFMFKEQNILAELFLDINNPILEDAVLKKDGS